MSALKFISMFWPKNSFYKHFTTVFSHKNDNDNHCISSEGFNFEFVTHFLFSKKSTSELVACLLSIVFCWLGFLGVVSLVV